MGSAKADVPQISYYIAARALAFVFTLGGFGMAFVQLLFAIKFYQATHYMEGFFSVFGPYWNFHDLYRTTADIATVLAFLLVLLWPVVGMGAADILRAIVNQAEDLRAIRYLLVVSEQRRRL